LRLALGPFECAGGRSYGTEASDCCLSEFCSCLLGPRGGRPYFLAFSPAGCVFGTDLGSGSAFDRLEGSARGSCSQHVDETVYLSVLFPGCQTPTFRKRRPRALCVLEMTGGPGFARNERAPGGWTEGGCLESPRGGLRISDAYVADRVEIDRVVGELRQFLARIEGRLEGSVGAVAAAGSQKTVRTSRDETP
jgi:hypothetical protein